MGKGFALVYWIQSKRTEVLKCLMIPEKYRREGAIVTLKDQHVITGASEPRLAKIVKIDQSKANLGSIIVDVNTGMITQKSSKQLLRVAAKKSGQLTRAKNLKKGKRTEKKHMKTKFVDDHCDSDESSRSEFNSKETANALEDYTDDEKVSRAMKSLLFSATHESIKFFRKFLLLMEQAYEKRQKYSRKKNAIIDEPKPVPIIDADPTNLLSSLGDFLPRMTITAIYHRNQDNNDWRKLTTDILVEIYGQQLAHMSAKGSRGAPGIDPAVFRAIYDLLNERLGWILPPKDFVRHINKVCSNRKKSYKTRMENNARWSNMPIKLEVPTTSTHIESFDEPETQESSMPTYERYMAKSEEPCSNLIITSVRSAKNSFTTAPSPSIGHQDIPPDQAHLYQEYLSESSSNQLDANQVPSHYMDDYMS